MPVYCVILFEWYSICVSETEHIKTWNLYRSVFYVLSSFSIGDQGGIKKHTGEEQHCLLFRNM